IHYTHLICKNRVAAERNRLTLRDALPICTRWRKAPPADDLRSSQFSHKGNPESDPDPSRAPPVRRDALDSRIRCLRTHGAHNRRSEEHTSELQSRENLVCRLLLEKKQTYE